MRRSPSGSGSGTSHTARATPFEAERRIGGGGGGRGLHPAPDTVIRTRGGQAVTGPQAGPRSRTSRDDGDDPVLAEHEARIRLTGKAQG